MASPEAHRIAARNRPSLRRPLHSGDCLPPVLPHALRARRAPGAVLDALEKQGALENTLVVYMGDNGFLLGEHGLFDKRVMYEPSIRVPLLAHCPALFRAGQVIDGMALNIDICSTFLDAAGVPAPSNIHGRSLLPLLRGQTAGWREEFPLSLFERGAPHPGVIGLRTDRYALMEYQGIWDINELYDLKQDPQQKNNVLAGSETTTQSGGWLQRIKSRETRDVTADLHRRMVTILEATGGLDHLDGTHPGLVHGKETAPHTKYV